MQNPFKKLLVPKKDSFPKDSIESMFVDIAADKNRVYNDFQPYIQLLKSNFIDTKQDVSNLNEAQWNQLNLPIGIKNSLMFMIGKLNQTDSDEQSSSLVEGPKNPQDSSGTTIQIYFQNQVQKLKIPEECKHQEIQSMIRDLINVPEPTKLLFLDEDATNMLLSGSMKDQEKVHVSIFIPESSVVQQGPNFRIWSKCRQGYGTIDNSISNQSIFIFDDKVSRTGSGDFSWAQTPLFPNSGKFTIKLIFSEIICCTFLSIVKEGVEIKPYHTELERSGGIVFSMQAAGNNESKNQLMTLIVDMDKRIVTLRDETSNKSTTKSKVQDNVRLVWTDTKHNVKVTILQD